MGAGNDLRRVWTYLPLYVLFGMQVTHATSQLLFATLSGSAHPGYVHCAAGEVNDVDQNKFYKLLKQLICIAAYSAPLVLNPQYYHWYAAAHSPSRMVAS